jgi:prevent-host-death family protein
MRTLNVAEAKKQFSDLLGRVAYAGEAVLITRRGRPMAKLVPAGDASSRVSDWRAKGWLEDDDPFFEIVADVVAQRSRHRPRVLARARTRRAR